MNADGEGKTENSCGDSSQMGALMENSRSVKFGKSAAAFPVSVFAAEGWLGGHFTFLGFPS
jgi:hypothetical protein